jgi:AraC-like DNA-binding protein
MRALKKSVSSLGSFTVQEYEGPVFDPNWHFHPEYQLFCVLAGSGTRFIGDSIKPFLPGDMVFLGPDVPHLWRSDTGGTGGETAEAARGIVIYFSENFLGKEFFEKQEMVLLRQLLENARQGLEIRGRTRELVAGKMRELTGREDFVRVLALLDILHTIALCGDYKPICSRGYVNACKPSETERMRKVHEYVTGHFQEEISLEKVAALTSMAPSAFCRYFRARSNKTFSDFVSEVRIGHACRLLIGGNLSVTQVAYACGFRTMSNFNRQFKAIVHESPLRYQRRFAQ